MEVKVYTKESCVQCTATERLMEKHNINYERIPLGEDLEALERLKAEGYMQAPIVETDEETWSGFRPDKIKALAQKALEKLLAEEL